MTREHISHRKDLATQALFLSAGKACQEHGTCEVPLKKGSLRISQHANGAVDIEVLTSLRNPRYEISVTARVASHANPEQLERIKTEYGSEEQFLGRISDLINRALERDLIKTVSCSWESLAIPPTDKASSLATTSSPVAAAWRSVEVLLKSPDGRDMQEALYPLAGHCSDLRIIRTQSDPQLLFLENIQRDYRRDVLVFENIRITPSSIAYYLADAGKPYGDEQYALRRLQGWLEAIQAARANSVKAGK